MSSIGPFVREIEVFPDPEHLPLPIRREAPATAPVTAPVEPIKERPLPTNPDTDKPTTEPVTTPVEPEKVPV